MFVVRQAKREDETQVLHLAQHLNSLNLPADESAIREIIGHSLRSFSAELPREAREYVLVLEDLTTKEIVGTSMIHGQHGTRKSPHIFLEVSEQETYSESIDRHFVHQTLRLGYNFNGPTEIGGLILLPKYRGHISKLGKSLSFSRFLYMALHREDFRDEVLSELLPPLREDGTSILWEHFGKRFTAMTYTEADKLSRTNKEFIRALFPHAEIYSSLFPESVRDVIGKVGSASKGAERMLSSLGFKYAQHIDPFDGGPHYIARADQVLSHCILMKCTSKSPGSKWAMAAAEKADFRAVPALLSEEEGSVYLDTVQQDALGVEEGEEVCVFVQPS